MWGDFGLGRQDVSTEEVPVRVKSRLRLRAPASVLLGIDLS